MRKLRYGMIGGGIGSFIGAVHRRAAAMDGQIELVCGAFDVDPEKSLEAGKELGVYRTYGSYTEMIEKEQQLPEPQRMDFVVIVTPNHVHYEPARLALSAGFHVVCEKPVTFSTEQANKLKSLVDESGLLFAVTHPYTSYPLVKQAREMVQSGELGSIRKVLVEYNQGWLSTELESTGNQQASWRTDPTKAGKAGSIGDIGTHAFNMAEYVSGLEVYDLCADLTSFVPNRLLDDDANVLLRFGNGAKGILTVSQICVGEENNLTLRVYGEKGSLSWNQQEPNSLTVRIIDKPVQVYRAGDAGNLSSWAMNNTRLPMGHPEGLIEAFANIYCNFANAVRAHQQNVTISTDYPSIDEGIRTMQFIDTVIASSENENKWTKFSQ